MSRTLPLLLTIAFLGTQMLSFAHAAEYGSWEHEHEGTTCEICLSAKYQDFTGSSAASGTCLVRHAQYVPQAPADVIVLRRALNTGITRGPPLSS